MTREEAIEKLKMFAPMVVDETREALEMAIEALDGQNEWINKHDVTTIIREECWSCNSMVNDDLCMKILEYPSGEGDEE